MVEKRFSTAINCMDGRCQEPIISYMKKTYDVDLVDMITETGPNKILALNEEKEVVGAIKKRVEISVFKHGSEVIVIAGHYDCAGNPSPENEQKEHLFAAKELVESWDMPVKTIDLLWLDSDFNITEVTAEPL